MNAKARSTYALRQLQLGRRSAGAGSTTTATTNMEYLTRQAVYIIQPTHFSGLIFL